MFRFLVLDVDGTLTDGKMYYSSSGDSIKAFSVKDGHAIADILPLLKIEPVIISGGNCPAVVRRAADLGIKKVHLGIKDKLTCLNNILDDENASLSEVVYIGDDLNDLECMQAILKAQGLIACPADAVNEVKDLCSFVSSRNGGDGAVRELVDWLRYSNNQKQLVFNFSNH